MLRFRPEEGAAMTSCPTGAYVLFSDVQEMLASLGWKHDRLADSNAQLRRALLACFSAVGAPPPPEQTDESLCTAPITARSALANAYLQAEYWKGRYQQLAASTSIALDHIYDLAADTVGVAGYHGDVAQWDALFEGPLAPVTHLGEVLAATTPGKDKHLALEALASVLAATGKEATNG